MTKKKDDTAVLLTSANITAYWLQNMSQITAKNPTGDKEFDRETDKLLSSAAGTLLRWKIMTGMNAGILQLPSIEDWERDEFD